MGKAEIARKIKEARLKAGLTQAQVASRVGITYQAISNYERGLNRIDSETLMALCKVYGVSVTSIVGNEFNLDDILSLPGIEPPPRWVKKPLLGNIACGQPILAVENIEDYILVPENIHCDFLLRCKGDSMINARILDGDIVMIRHQEDVENGEIAAVRIDGEVTLKRVYKHPGMVQLMPENPVYPPMIYNNGNCSEISIVGKAIAFLSLVR
ncbi:MAG: transcriptional repressor LexA [Candidatus Pelethousia sp.]|nr:transcriptional repressor LexA [Candidatus Pelethousia sp.]